MNYQIFLAWANGKVPFHSYYSSILPMKGDLITIDHLSGLQVYEVKHRNMAGVSNTNNILLIIEKVSE